MCAPIKFPTLPKTHEIRLLSPSLRIRGLSTRNKQLICSEALIIYGIHGYNRRIHKYPYLFIKFKDFTVTSGVL